jgi:hypothetical protein
LKRFTYIDAARREKVTQKKLPQNNCSSFEAFYIYFYFENAGVDLWFQLSFTTGAFSSE